MTVGCDVAYCGFIHCRIICLDNLSVQATLDGSLHYMLKGAVFCYVLARYGTAQYAILFVACHCFSISYMRLYHALLPCVVLYPVVSSCNMLYGYLSLLSFFCTFLHVGASCPFLLHPIGLCGLTFTLQYIFRCQIVSCCIFIYIYIFISLSLSLCLSLSLPCLQCPCRPCTDAILGSFPNTCSALCSANAWVCTASCHNHVFLFVYKTLKPAL